MNITRFPVGDHYPKFEYMPCDDSILTPIQGFTLFTALVFINGIMWGAMLS